MHNTKIVRLLETFQPEEWRSLAKVIQSPAFNSHEDVEHLFHYLRRQITGNSGKNGLKAVSVYTHLFPGQPFEARQLHHISSYLYKVAEEFLAWREWKQETAQKELYLARAMRKRKLNKPFRRNLTKGQRKLEAQPLRHSDYFNRTYSLQLEQLRYSEQEGRKSKFDLRELTKAHDISFISEKLKTACAIFSQPAAMVESVDLGLLDAVMQYLEKHPYLQQPAVGIYYYGYLALLDMEEDRHFEKMKSMLFQHRSQFPQEELADLFILAINNCIRRLNAGKRAYFNEVFDLYRLGLEMGVFLEKGRLSPYTYSNIIVTGLRLKAFEWVEQFIFIYKDKLPPQQREGFFNYNLANFYFEKGDFDKAMPLLLQMEYADDLHNLSARAMLAKMYFELRELDSLSHLLKSFHTYLRRKKKLGYHKNIYLNFIRYFQKMLKAIHTKDSEELIARLIEEITGQEVLRDKEWFLEQLEKYK